MSLWGWPADWVSEEVVVVFELRVEVVVETGGVTGGMCLLSASRYDLVVVVIGVGVAVGEMMYGIELEEFGMYLRIVELTN